MANQALQVKRIQAEIQQFKNDPEPHVFAQPTPNSIFEWHFTIRGQPETDFEGGFFHGRIDLPAQYPMKPPNIYFINPNGRFQINTKICLNITKFHPEHWNPSFTIKTMLTALHAHFAIKEELSGVGSLTCSSSTIKQIAKESENFVCKECGEIKLPFINQEKKLIEPVNDNQPEQQQQEQQKKEDQEQQKEDIDNVKEQQEESVNDDDLQEQEQQQKLKEQLKQDLNNSDSKSEEFAQNTQELEQQLQFQKLFQNRIQSEVENLYKICSNISSINQNFDKQKQKNKKKPMSYDIDEPNQQSINWKLVEQLTQFHDVSQQGSQSSSIFEYMQETLNQYVDLSTQIKEQLESAKPKVINNTAIKKQNYNLLSNTIWGLIGVVLIGTILF